MSKIQQDQFIDDEEEETCPLCVEEFDLSDRNFRPCPCGYQICQFCYNNIKTTMNGLCPACRRPYDDKNIEWKQITPEEMASHKAEIAQKAKKNAAARAKEAQKREADSLSRKHLAGLRVVQKNLVYVTGLSPTVREDKLLETLRGDKYFGQYGKIVKIVVSKAKDRSDNVGVYVTFARKEDAATCIAAVDGSQNGERVLRAQFGTTKYCSAYLRNENCNNRNCMFLHEPGEENESFTRQDLSSMNVISTQQPAQAHGSTVLHPTLPQLPPQSAPQPPAAAVQAKLNKDSLDAGEGPALPSTASWGNKTVHSQSRRGSRATTGSGTSPAIANAVPSQHTPELVQTELDSASKKLSKPRETVTGDSLGSQGLTSTLVKNKSTFTQTSLVPYLDNVLQAVASPTFKFDVSSAYSDSVDDQTAILPLLWDPNGGAKRRQIRIRKAEERQRREAEELALLPVNSVQDQDEQYTEGGSLQLGGEPEDPSHGQNQQHAIQPPSQQALSIAQLRGGHGLPTTYETTNLGLHTRGLTPQQQQVLQQLRSTSSPTANGHSAFQQGGQAYSHQGGILPGHARNSSRFSFANDSSTASTNVKPVANAKLMNQQSSMMPQNQHFNQQNQFFASGVQGPPPGLKTSGTPPVSGGGMFAQGHGFATAGVGYGANAAVRNNQNEEMMRELLRGRGSIAGASSGMTEAAKRELLLPYLQSQAQPSGTGSGPLYGNAAGAFSDAHSVASTNSSSLHTQKTKKKKVNKHRHANTSSSSGIGGANVVDVADSNAMQARLVQQHQQGSYTGANQGNAGGFSSAVYNRGFGGW